MLKNATYNLMETASVISKGLHRYDTFEKDAQSCQACQQLWGRMKRADQEQLQQILRHVAHHLAEEPHVKRSAA